MVHADCPDPVAVVFDVVPVNVPYSVPDAAANPRLVLILVMSVETLDKTCIKVPVVGADLEVIAVPVWLPILDSVLTKLAQFVAATVPPALTVPNAVCPQPLSVLPVLQMLLILGLPVLTNPLKSAACIKPPLEYVILSFAHFIVTMASTDPASSEHLSASARPIVLNAVASPGRAARALPLPAETSLSPFRTLPMT